MPKKLEQEFVKEDLKLAATRYRRYLEDNGLRASTIPICVLHVSMYLEFAETDSSYADDSARFLDYLHGLICQLYVNRRLWISSSSFCGCIRVADHWRYVRRGSDHPWLP
jgi:hypothetical protein